MDELFKASLLPIVGGFLFVVCSWRFRFLALRTSGEKLIFICAVIGISLAIVANAITHIAMGLADLYSPTASLTYHRFREALSPYPTAQVLALALGPLCGRVLNKLKGFDREESLHRALRDIGDQLESRLNSAKRSKKAIMLTMKNGRVYVGYVTQIVPPMVGPRHICILPMMSGHRCANDNVEPDGKSAFGRVTFTTYYEELAEVILSLAEQGAGDDVTISLSAPANDGVQRATDFNPFDLGLLLPIDEIQVATFFDANLYAFLNRERDPGPWAALPQRAKAASPATGPTIVVQQRPRVIKNRIIGFHRKRRTPP